jgi:hypothetical protein
MCVQAVSPANDTPLALWVVERLFIGYKGGLKGLRRAIVKVRRIGSDLEDEFLS